MENYTFRRATLSDVDALVSFRIMMIGERSGTQAIDIKKSTASYFEAGISSGTFVSWLALAGDKVVATSGLAVYKIPPHYGNPSGLTGEVNTMYTLDGHRRQGLAKVLLKKIIGEAKGSGCTLLRVTASTAGKLLYQSCGFASQDNYLTYDLNQ